jgi:hypothetical protein
VATAKAKKLPTLVTINRSWQLAFITAIVAAQAVAIGTVLWMFTRQIHYVSSGTWAFQISQWVYPLLFLGASYAFVRKRVVGAVPRAFWAVFLTTIGMVAWYALEGLLNAMFNIFSWWPQITSADKSWWSAFGITWTEMIVLFSVYCLVLGLIARERSRK